MREMLHAVRKTGPRPGIELLHVAMPGAPAQGEALIRVRYAGICGTDLHVDDWQGSYHFMAPHLPVTLGHEFSGVVAQIDKQCTDLQPGDRVVVRPSITCGKCIACMGGEFDHCEDRRGLGLTRDGAFSTYVLAPVRNCLRLPAALRDDVAALAEPFTIAWQALAQSQLEGQALAGRRILVLGPGIIGQAIALLAREAGALVFIAGRNDAARCTLLRALGFSHVLDTANAEEEHAYGNWGAFDVIFEATGSPESIQAALPKLRRNGVLVATGIHPRPLLLDVTAMVRNQHRLIGSFRPPEASWPRVLELLVKLQPMVLPLITHRLPLSESQHAFDLAHARLAGKVLLMPEPE